MASAENRLLAKPHYIIRRSRSGRFNFALITDAGRLTGSVSVPLRDRANAEMEREARDKIRALAESFVEATSLTLKAGPALHHSEAEPSLPTPRINAFG